MHKSYKKEVKTLKRKTILGTVLALSLAVTVVIVAVAPTIADAQSSAGVATLYGNGANVVLQLPQAGGALANRPITLQIQAFDFDKRSDYGGPDVLIILLWVPTVNSFVPVAGFTDNPDPAARAWHSQVSAGSPMAQNEFAVADKDLEIWVERGKSSGSGCWTWDQYGRYVWDYDSEDITLIANLTVSKDIKIGDPFPPFFKALNFTLPPLTLVFRGVGNAYSEKTTQVLPSGWTVKTSSRVTPAWVQVSIPAWLASGRMQFDGYMEYFNPKIYSPPA